MKVERVVVTNLDGYVDVHGTRVRGRSAALDTSTLQTAATYPSLISLMVSVDVKHHVYLNTYLLTYGCHNRSSQPELCNNALNLHSVRPSARVPQFF